MLGFIEECGASFIAALRSMQDPLGGGYSASIDAVTPRADTLPPDGRYFLHKYGAAGYALDSDGVVMFSFGSA